MEGRDGKFGKKGKNSQEKKSQEKNVSKFRNDNNCNIFYVNRELD